MEATSREAQAELARRHKAAATTVLGLLVATILLSVIAFLARPYFTKHIDDANINLAVRIIVLTFGLGAVAWRRTKFQAMRLQDIAGLAGVSGLLKTLEKTTIQLALLGATIASVGFITTLATGNDLYTYWAGAIAVLVFVYCYPTKTSWLRTLYRFTEQNPVNPINPENPGTNAV